MWNLEVKIVFPYMGEIALILQVYISSVMLCDCFIHTIEATLLTGTKNLWFN